MGRTVIPFGPQHPVLPEPIHLTLTLEDDRIVEALPRMGYVHRGLELLAQKRTPDQMVQVVERVCGICSMMHGMCFCQALEEIHGIEPPPRAKWLRVFWAEMHRLHSHLLWLGLFADALGFENLFMGFWRVRERIMDMQDATTGNRVMVSVSAIGGVRRDLPPDLESWCRRELIGVRDEVHRLGKAMLGDYSTAKRTKGIGVLTAERAHDLGTVGPVLRGSGVAHDIRMLDKEIYGALEFTPCVETDGDSWSRLAVRIAESEQSANLALGALDKLPQGDITVKVKGRPEGEAVRRVEQPRGEALYYVKADGGKLLDRVRIRTPTFANIPALLDLLPGHDLADAPVLVLTIDPCISCTER
ncbi:nickel-dependent hydrogenase large subunit [Pseudodesulfovibrio sediminis]|uniref:NADH dehydrogenase n=1 Tax=Pseudodesulfovibrio sediminis TaxID=2810563 RepID=A0ABM7PA54_9BACT|nr:nickel-dependent hydrogenase large subunit [Pseudodesulfovibrio sediminis]BCS89917.1 NADH dehydrogenase [Pseudodesulfovibrio sediminis]